ncbi:hypothetical protein OS493_002734 [Desmophyllum pertusum]|uniref:Uncharacterized protein n=1 Tax=Desmophyllum pertusum TaxID=174260 RepID=A0A9W9YTI4_9CNID|nr:hypothetical protein OS493_002734 [Desmophyllum pertusum]
MTSIRRFQESVTRLQDVSISVAVLPPTWSTVGDVLGNASIKPRAKRASYHHSYSLKHLLYEIIDEQHDLDKTKESIYILERDHCTNIKSVGNPVTHNARYYVGWGLDERPGRNHGY